jgi:hypothetical protein
MIPTEIKKAMDSLAKWNRRNEKRNGWTPTSYANEPRRNRIKRLRRWNRLMEHYPDMFTYSSDRNEKFWLVSKQTIDGVDIMVTAIERPNYMADLTSDNPELITQFNGYCRFKTKPVMESGYNGILSYVPVHGGITYAHHKHGVSVYGFDTAHAGDDENPMVRNAEWVEFQSRLMAVSIRIAARFEEEYNRYRCNYARADVIERFHKEIYKQTSQRFVITNNFGAMINVLSGKV